MNFQNERILPLRAEPGWLHHPTLDLSLVERRLEADLFGRAELLEGKQIIIKASDPFYLAGSFPSDGDIGRIFGPALRVGEPAVM